MRRLTGDPPARGDRPARGDEVARRDRLLLTAGAAGLAAVEAAVLQGLHFVAATPLAPQASAPAPYGGYHDLRWVWTFASGPWSVVWMLIALVVVRSALDAVAVSLAWPGGIARPAYPVLWRRTAGLTVLTVVALSPWASAAFAGAATGLSWFLLGAILVSAAVTLTIPHGVLTGRWWRPPLRLRALGWTALGWVTVTLAALVVTESPGWVALPVAAAAGVANARCWVGVVGAVAGPEPSRRSVPALPLLPVLVSGGLLVAGGFAAGSLLGTGSGQAEPARLVHGAAIPPGPLTHPVVYVAGYDSTYHGGAPHLFGPDVQAVHFSYRGLGPHGLPLPYDAASTHQSLQRSATLLAQQVEALHRRSGRPVSVVAESEGTMVARAYFATRAHPPVDAYVQISPLIRPSRVFVPTSGATGPGYLGGVEVRGILALFRLESPEISGRADMPFVRSLVDNAPRYRDQTLCPPTGVRSHLFLPLEGALTVYRGPLAADGWTALPAYHAGLLGSATVRHDVATFLAGAPAPKHGGWHLAYQLIRGAAGAWQIPALPLGAHPAWHAGPGGDPAFGHHSCG